jgi:hypothetical protein
MNPHMWHSRRFLAALLAGSLAIGLFSAGPARAEGQSKLDSSLKWIPADAAFYTSALRTGEQFQIVGNSKAWAKLKALPVVQMALQQVEAQLKKPSNPQLAAILHLYQQPENQQLVQLLGDMVSQEIFCYGGDSTVGFMDLLARLNGATQIGRAFTVGILAGAQGKDPNKVGPHVVLQTMSENLDLIKVPDLVLGFKVSKTEAAEAQLKRLEELLNGLAAQVPQLGGRVKRSKVAGGDFLTVTLDGTLVPWDKVSFKQFEEKEGEFDKFLDKLKQLKLTVSLGVRDNYVLLGVGESTAGLAKLGHSSEGLAGRPELKSLERHAGERITSVSYVSQALRARLSTSKESIDELAKHANEALKEAGLPPTLQDKISKDLASLATDVKSLIPTAGAMMSYAFLNGRGQESFTYDWSEARSADASKPLTLLHHVGRSPILAVVGRSKPAPEQYQLLVKWIKVANGYFEELVLPRLDENQKAQYEQVTKVVYPFLQKFDKITSTLLLPSLQDGQQAFVLDGKLESKHWQQQLPTTDKPMPMLEPAVLLGVSDAGRLRKAVGEYRTIVNELIAKLHELNPAVEDFQIPEPETHKAGGGTLYFYPVREELGLDMQIVPNAGLSDHVAVLSLSLSHGQRLLGNHPLKVDGGPLADLSRPRTGAVYFDWPALVNTLSPWVQIAGQLAAQQQPEGANAVPNLKEILPQIETFLEVAKCFRTYTSSTYVEDKALVTHSEVVVKDL